MMASSDLTVPAESETFDAELRAASALVNTGSLPRGFHEQGGVIWFQPFGAKANEASPLPFEVCQTFSTISRATDEHSAQPGTYIRWLDARGVEHDWIVQDTILHEDARVLPRELAARNFRVEPGAPVYSALKSLFSHLRNVTTRHMTSFERAGWHSEGRTFLLPDGSVYGDSDALFARRVAGRNRQKGTLADWQGMVAEIVPGNSRLLLAIALPFAGPLLDLAGEDFACIHFFGDSSVGKSTAAVLGASVWGEPSKHDQVRSWRATDNGLEGVAAEHTDTVLVLDEIGQVDPKIIGECAYMLANGTGKSRAARDGSAREVRCWRLAVLSTGEHTVEDAIKSTGRRAPGGIDVRLINVPAKAGAGMGLFENCHGMRPADFAGHIVQSCTTFYGTAGRAFVDALARVRAENAKAITDLVSLEVDEFLAAALTSKADGQVQRVARKFGVISAAGEIAIMLEVLPFETGSIRDACKRCFDDWLAQRDVVLGTAGALRSKEHGDLIARIRAHVEQYGGSKFENLDFAEEDRLRVVGPRSGYFKDGDYWFMPSALTELLSPTKTGDGLAVLYEANLLNCSEPIGDPKRDYRRSLRVKNSSTTAIAVRGSILDDGET